MDNEISRRLMSILYNNFKFSKNLNWEEIENIPLTSKQIGFDSIGLYYLLMKIEEEFQICFNFSDLSNNGFYTLGDIVMTLKSHGL